MRYADPLAQSEIDRLRAEVRRLNNEGDRLLEDAKLWVEATFETQAEVGRLRACSDPTPPAEGERHTAEQLWHHLLEASSHRRLYVLNQFLEAQDDANRCFLMNHAHRLGEE